ncbi:MAG: aldehyde ferredoxin oxidoreductase family protein [Proteobacteria bacterium]|nr:aldehyde ferredoxin oxidoreductase family protein [Pseudomonadota bacterium]
MFSGYVGKILFVDLTAGTITEEILDDHLAMYFFGGYGIGARVLYDRMKPRTDPLGPDNILGFVTGPVTGTGAVLGGRYTVVCKSPVTGGFNDANSGGYFGPELKKAGYDAVFISGISQIPVYLWIKDGQAKLRDASRLWGLDSKDTQKALEKETGESKLRAAVIGLAGEKLSLISCIINDGHRAAARGGAGAVMGSKNLKAIAVRGTGKIPVSDRAKVNELNKACMAIIKNPPDDPIGWYVTGFKTLGTGATTTASALSGDSPVKNWAGVGIVDFGEEKAQKIGSQSFDTKYKTAKYGCANCPLKCGAVYRVDSGKWPLGETERPEYETAAAFGTLLLVDDVEAILKCNEICNRYGLDTISAGSTIAWAMECYENGVLTKEDLDGIDLRWGNAEAVVEITQKIADQDGCGKVLARGSAGAAKICGKGTEYLITFSGIEPGMHDPRLQPVVARTFQYDPTPGRHCKGGGGLSGIPPSDPSFGQADVGGTCYMEVLNASGFCMFFMFASPFGSLPSYIAAITGMPFSDQDMYQTGLRILTMRHAFNLREGLVPAGIQMPARIVGEPPLKEGPTAGVAVDHKMMGEKFFAALGWNRETGKPEQSALEAMEGMDDVARDLYA